MIYLKIENLSAGFHSTILDNVSFDIKKGEFVLILGPNGSGKSTLCRALMGDPSLKTSGNIFLEGRNITNLRTDERAKLGMFLSFQDPPAIEGVTILKMLYKLKGGKKDIIVEKKRIQENAEKIGLKQEYVGKDINVNFSGGEKKRAELLQLAELNPEFIMLDEPDSGMDADGLRMLGDLLEKLKEKGKTILLITHQSKISEIITPDKVILMNNGSVSQVGGPEILEKIQKKGYSED
ncbi:Fe-S cluster assembly ATPase SufC [Candidatus Micrarchaeota archaeon]|nr:Fe-S cluster assembly ATPase SufC [Candidatus Micrarchaeota archaeon]